MSHSQVLELARRVPFLLAREVNLPQEEVSAAFESIRATEADYEVLYTVTIRDERSTRILVSRSATEAMKYQESLKGGCDVDVYALQRRTDTKGWAPRRPAPSLVPSRAVVRREYPLVSRKEAESYTGGECCDGGDAALKTNVPGKFSAAAARDPSPQKKLAVSTADANIVTGQPQQVQEKKVLQQPQPKKQQMLLGSPQSGGKRSRAPDDTKDQTEVRPKKPRKANTKTEKMEGTTSLMKLAKISAKKRKNDNNNRTEPLIPKSSHSGTMRNNLLDEEYDEEGGNVRNGRSNGSNCSRSSSSSRERSNERRDMELMNEETPFLDAAFSPKENDDIILCDDAAPMVFCVPEPASCTSKKEQRQSEQEQQGGGDGQSLNGNNESTAQLRLTGFLLPEVAEFQKQYTREVITNTVFENGEYFCKDKVCYRHKERNEVISEEEFRRRGVNIMSCLQADSPKNKYNDNEKTCTTNHDRVNPSSSSSGNVKPTNKRAASSGKPPKVEKQLRSQPVTLFSYFKPIGSS